MMKDADQDAVDRAVRDVHAFLDKAQRLETGSVRAIADQFRAEAALARTIGTSTMPSRNISSMPPTRARSPIPITGTGSAMWSRPWSKTWTTTKRTSAYSAASAAPLSISSVRYWGSTG